MMTVCMKSCNFLSDQATGGYVIQFFWRFTPFSRDSANVYWNVLECSPIRSSILERRYIPILKMFQLLFKNRSFVGVEPPEDLKNVPEIMTIFFSKLVI